jgi:hypothetical protein
MNLPFVFPPITNLPRKFGTIQVLPPDHKHQICVVTNATFQVLASGNSEHRSWKWKQPTANKAFFMFEKYPLDMGMQAQLSLGVISPSLLPGGGQVGEKNDKLASLPSTVNMSFFLCRF